MSNTTIQIKKSSTSGNVPGSLGNGELAINTRDGKLYYNSAIGIVTFLAGWGNSFATVNANSTLVLASSNSDILTIVGSNTINVVGNSTTKIITISSNVLTGLVPGAYTNLNATVDLYGRITSASNGTGGSGGGTSNSLIYLNSFTGDGSTTNFTLTNPLVNTQIVHINGVYQMFSAGAYSMSSNVVIFSAAPYNGAAIEITSFSSTTNTQVLAVTSFGSPPRNGAIVLTAADITTAVSQGTISSNVAISNNLAFTGANSTVGVVFTDGSLQTTKALSQGQVVAQVKNFAMP